MDGDRPRRAVVDGTAACIAFAAGNDGRGEVSRRIIISRIVRRNFDVVIALIIGHYSVAQI